MQETTTGQYAGPAPDERLRQISPRRRRWAMLLTILLTPLAGVAGLELIFRAFVDVTDVPLVFWDPLIGLRRAPDQSGRYLAGGTIAARYHFNAQGWNCPEDYKLAKPPGVRRIALIGDSQVEALQVSPEQAHYAVAQRRMNRPDRPVQWYPFGSTGLGTAQEHQIIRHYVLDYQPDVVVLLFIQNDPFDTSPYIMPMAPFQLTAYLDAAGELVFDLPRYWTPNRWRRLSTNFALIRYFAIQKRLLEKLIIMRDPMWNQMKTGGQPLREFTEAVVHPSVPGLAGMSLRERQRKTWELMEKLFAAMRDECRSRGAIFAIADRGAGDYIDEPIRPNPIREVPPDEDPYCLGPRLRHMSREIVEPMVRKLNIPYLDLAGPVREMVARRRQSHIYPDDGHYAPLGHEAAGEALAEWVESLLRERPAAGPAGHASEGQGGS